MRFSLRKFISGSTAILFVIVFWNVDFSSDVERSGRSYKPHVCSANMWSNFDNIGDMSFPWKPVDELEQYKNNEMPCSEMYTIPVVNMTLTPPSVNPRKETIVFKGDINKLANGARFFYFIMRARAFPYRKEIDTMPLAPITCTSDQGLNIPNAVHFLWVGDEEFGEVHYLSMRSAAAVHGPTLILLHFVIEEPQGWTWDKIISEIPCLKITKIEPMFNFGNTSFVKKMVLKLQILHEYGGIYADFGVMFLKPLYNLMYNKVVMGKDHGHMQNNIIMAEANSPFIGKWMKSLANYSIMFPTEHTQIIPYRLSNDHPEYGVKFIIDKLTRPSYLDGMEWLTHQNWDINENYCAHLYYKSFIPASLPFLKLNRSALIHLDSTYGQMVRKVLYGSFQIKFFEKKLDKYEKLIKDNSIMKCNRASMFGKIPLILHFVLLDEEFNYNQYLGIRLAMKYVRPNRVIFHQFGGVKEPDSKLMVRIKREIKCLEIREIESFDASYIPVFKANIKRRLDIIASILLKDGGIFLEENTLIRHSLPKAWHSNSITIQRYDPAIPFTATKFILAEKGCKALEQWLFRNPSRSFYQTGIQSFVDLPGVTEDSMVAAVDERLFYSSKFGESFKQVPALFFDKSSVIKDVMSETTEHELIRSDSAYGGLVRDAFVK